MPRLPDIDALWAAHDAGAARLSPRAGRVFTPRALALRLATAVLAPCEAAPRIIDPACGRGSLLLGALEFAARERPHWLEPWAAGGLHGLELEPASAAACRALMAGAGVAADIRTCDALAYPPAEYDAVLANPPWVSFSGRQAAPLGPSRRAALARDFAACRRWPSLHGAFCELATRLVHDRGRIGLLLPLPVADLAAYAPAREAMTAAHRLESLVELGEHAFDGITEPAGMFVLAPGSAPWPARAVPAGRHKPLPDASFGDIGVHTGNAAKLLLAREAGPGCRPLRVGADVRPFALAQPELWLRPGPLPAGCYARAADESAFRRVRIVLRQTADRPVAARHVPATAFRNSVLACFGAPGHDDDYLVAVFNSRAAARIHRDLHRDARQRAFPQVKVSHLRALPVPGRDIGPLYDRIAAQSRAVQGGLAEPATIDALVDAAYAA